MNPNCQRLNAGLRQSLIGIGSVVRFLVSFCQLSNGVDLILRLALLVILEWPLVGHWATVSPLPAFPETGMPFVLSESVHHSYWMSPLPDRTPNGYHRSPEISLLSVCSLCLVGQGSFCELNY